MTIRQGSILFTLGVAVSVAFGSGMLLLHPAHDIPIGWQYTTTKTVEPPDPPEPEFAVNERPQEAQQETYDELEAALDAGDPTLLYFDVERLAAEIANAGNKGREPADPAIRDLIARDGEAILKRMLEPITCMKARFSSVHWVVPQREVTFITMYGPDFSTSHRVLSMRWSLHFDGDRWRLYDVENLTVGGRLSHFLAASRRSPRVNPPVGPQLAEVMAHVQHMNRLVARKMLDGPLLEQLPLPDRALADLWRGIMFCEERVYPQAIEHLQRAINRNNQLVVTHRWLADVFFFDRQYSESRNSGHRYAEAVPNDHTGPEKTAWAMLQIGEHRLAIDQYRRALAENPDSREAYNGLRYALPPEQLSELGQRFRRCATATNHLPSLVTSALQDDRPDYEGATILVTSFFQKNPNHPEGFMQAALISLHRKDVQQAFASFRRGLATLPPTVDRELYAERFLPRLAHEMKHTEIYLGLADRDQEIGFRVLADDIVDDTDLEDEPESLVALMQTHRQQHPNDPWLDFYQAELLLAQGKRDDAEQLLANRMKQPMPEPMHERFWSQRLNNFAQQKQYMRAYEALEPKRKVFRQITNWFYLPNDIPQREQLIQAHAKADPTDPLLLYWQADIHYHKDELAAALALLERFQHAGGPEYTLVERQAIDRLVRCLVRLNRLPDAKKIVANLLVEHNVTLHFLMAVATGDHRTAEQMLDERAKQEYWQRSILQDRDVQHYYTQPRFEALRAKYPIPKNKPLPP